MAHIRFFDPNEPFGALSTWYPFELIIEGERWAHAEAYIRKVKMDCHSMQLNWSFWRIETVQRALRAKIKQQPGLRAILNQTGTATLQQVDHYTLHHPDQEAVQDEINYGAWIGEVYSQIRDQQSERNPLEYIGRSSFSLPESLQLKWQIQTSDETQEVQHAVQVATDAYVQFFDVFRGSSFSRYSELPIQQLHRTIYYRAEGAIVPCNQHFLLGLKLLERMLEANLFYDSGLIKRNVHLLLIREWFAIRLDQDPQVLFSEKLSQLAQTDWLTAACQTSITLDVQLLKQVSNENGLIEQWTDVMLRVPNSKKCLKEMNKSFHRWAFRNIQTERKLADVPQLPVKSSLSKWFNNFLKETSSSSQTWSEYRKSTKDLSSESDLIAAVFGSGLTWFDLFERRAELIFLHELLESLLTFHFSVERIQKWMALKRLVEGTRVSTQVGLMDRSEFLSHFQAIMHEQSIRIGDAHQWQLIAEIAPEVFLLDRWWDVSKEPWQHFKHHVAEQRRVARSSDG